MTVGGDEPADASGSANRPVLGRQRVHIHRCYNRTAIIGARGYVIRGPLGGACGGLKQLIVRSASWPKIDRMKMQ
jgi:hypothetical protein